MQNEQIYRTWAEIDMDALAHNMRVIRETTNKNAKIMAVIKADAYGHGMLPVYRTLRENGADCFAVATLQEAIRLRKEGATEPILILGYVPAACAPSLLAHALMPTVFDLQTAIGFSEAAKGTGQCLHIHIKLDTGMGRIGFAADEASQAQTIGAIQKINQMDNLVIDGLFSHFSCSDTDAAYTNLQFDRYMSVCNALEARGVCVGTRHICNSAGIVLEKEKHLDMVRPGIILYGLHPDVSTYGKIDLKPVMKWCAHITHIKTVKAGTPISYGNTYIAQKDMRIGTVCVGYADGYARLLSGKTQMLVHGQRVNQIGRICMDQCMIDLTDVHTIHVGDEVVLMGDGFSADEMAALLGTINYEVVCDVGARVVRVYKEKQE